MNEPSSDAFWEVVVEAHGLNVTRLDLDDSFIIKNHEFMELIGILSNKMMLIHAAAMIGTDDAALKSRYRSRLLGHISYRYIDSYCSRDDKDLEIRHTEEE